MRKSRLHIDGSGVQFLAMDVDAQEPEMLATTKTLEVIECTDLDDFCTEEIPLISTDCLDALSYPTRSEEFVACLS